MLYLDHLVGTMVEKLTEKGILDMRDTYKEGYDDGKQAGYSAGEQAGYSKGEQALLEAMIRKKLKCGKDIAVIAQELEMEPAVIQEIIERISG